MIFVIFCPPALGRGGWRAYNAHQIDYFTLILFGNFIDMATIQGESQTTLKIIAIFGWPEMGPH